MLLIMTPCSFVQFDLPTKSDGVPPLHHIYPDVTRIERERLKHSPHREPGVVTLMDARPRLLYQA